jgi:hypothetical protein
MTAPLTTPSEEASPSHRLAAASAAPLVTACLAGALPAAADAVTDRNAIALRVATRGRPGPVGLLWTHGSVLRPLPGSDRGEGARR